MIMSEMSFITQLVVVVAALLYITKELSTRFEVALRRYCERHVNSINSLHRNTEEEIRTEFDFWWSDGPANDVQESLLTDPIVREQLQLVPEEMQDAAISSLLVEFQREAMHLAVHERLGSREADLHSKLPRIRGLRSVMLDQYEGHQSELKRVREKLFERKVDVEELERHFA